MRASLKAVSILFFLLACTLSGNALAQTTTCPLGTEKFTNEYGEVVCLPSTETINIVVHEDIGTMDDMRGFQLGIGLGYYYLAAGTLDFNLEYHFGVDPGAIFSFGLGSRINVIAGWAPTAGVDATAGADLHFWTPGHGFRFTLYAGIGLAYWYQEPISTEYFDTADSFVSFNIKVALDFDWFFNNSWYLGFGISSSFIIPEYAFPFPQTDLHVGFLF